MVGHPIGGSKQAEYRRTAELLVEIMDRDDKNGPYFVVALLHDAQYTHEDLGKLLPHLKEQPRGLARGATSRDLGLDKQMPLGC